MPYTYRVEFGPADAEPVDVEKRSLEQLARDLWLMERRAAARMDACLRKSQEAIARQEMAVYYPYFWIDYPYLWMARAWDWFAGFFQRAR